MADARQLSQTGSASTADDTHGTDRPNEGGLLSVITSLVPKNRDSGEEMPELLTQAEILSRLKRQSVDVQKVVYELAKRQVDAEVSRRTRMTTKASSMLAVVSVALTVATTVGGKLVAENADALRDSLDGIWWALELGLVLGVAAGFATVVMAALALWVRGFRDVNEATVLSEEKLGHLAKVTEKEGGEERAYAMMLAWVSAHLWSVAISNHRIHNRQSRRLVWAQRFFGAFVILVAVVSLVVVVTVLGPI